VITVGVTPRSAGIQQSSLTVGSGAAAQMVSVTDAGIAGNGAVVFDQSNQSQDFVRTYNQSNAVVAAAGSPSMVVVAYSTGVAGEGGTVSLSAAPGQSLRVGSYPMNASTLHISGSLSICTTYLGLTIGEMSFDGVGNLVRFAADLEIPCGNEAVSVELRAGSAIPYASLAIQPPMAGLNFGRLVVDTTAPAQQVTITNSGVAPVTVAAPAISGRDAAWFSVGASTCGTASPLQPGASCSYSITCTALDEGSIVFAWVGTTDSTLVGQHLVPLSCQGYPAPWFLYPPLDGLSNVDTTASFSWKTSPQAQAYRMTVGTSPGGTDLVDSGVLPASRSCFPVPALPTGRTLYATIYTEINGGWSSRQSISFTAAPGMATLTFPLNGQSNVDPTKPFTWSTILGTEAYYLVVGTTQYGDDLVNSGVFTSASSYPTPVLPAHRTLYATLFTEVNGGWSRYQSITFTTGAAMGTFTHPVNGQLGVATPSGFTWSTVAAAQAYYLMVGTTAYGHNLVNSGVLIPTQSSYRVPALPRGKLLYATLFTMVNNQWVGQLITFTPA
jgi:hypothetical protein